MKTLKLVLLVIFSVIIIALIAGLFIVRNISNSAIPPYQGEIELSGLNSEVTIFRDERGIPHIYALDEHDLYMATGFVMAQERLWQMDLIRRATMGTLSEIFGGDYVNTDLFLRALRIPEKSQMVIDNSDPEIIKCMGYFTDGVNQYIENAGKDLPPEFRILGYKPEPWTMANSANIIGYMGWDLAGSNLSGDIYLYRLFRLLGDEKARELVPYLDYTDTPVYPDFKLGDDKLDEIAEAGRIADKLAALGIVPLSGSNNWAVSGSGSETGMPLLSNDMHLSLSSPGIWIQMHQVIPGRLNVTGVLVPGEPFVVAGHNERIAWGMTNLMVDDIDLYAETINSDDTTEYFFNGSWHKMDIRQEGINIKGGEKVTLPLMFTHRGPIVSGFRGLDSIEVSMRWSGNDPSNELMAVYRLNRAEGWDDFREAVAGFRSVSQNFVYADVDGNIGLQVGGGVPVREGYGWMIHPGDTDEYDWKGYLTQDQLPFSFNPSSGSVSSANNKTVSDLSYPYYIGTYFALPYRINRIRQMLNEKEKFGLDDFKRMITDRHSDYAAKLVPVLLNALKTESDLNGMGKEMAGMLMDWDYDMSPDMITPTFFEYFRKNLASDLLSDDLGGLYNTINSTVRDYYLSRVINGSTSYFVDDITTDKEETFDMILVRAFHETISELEATYGERTTKWLWGDIHRFAAEHPLSTVRILDRVFNLNSKYYRVGGSNHTVSPYSYSANFHVDHGASERHIFNTANWDESFTVIPTGTSGIPASEFYLNQTEAYCKDKFYVDHFSDKAVREAAIYKLVLKPKKQVL